MLNPYGFCRPKVFENIFILSSKIPIRQRMKPLFYILLSIVFTLSSQTWASPEIEAMLTQHHWLRSNPELIDKFGPKVVDQTQRWIHAHKNDPELKSKAGQELLASQAHLANYQAVKAQFDKCVIKSQRQLDARILEADLAASDSPCSVEFGELSSLDDLNKKIASQMHSQQKKQLQNDVLEQQLLNSATTYMSLRHRYEDKYVASKDVDRLVKEFCRHESGEVCSKSFKEKFGQELKVYAGKLTSEPRASAKSASVEINKGVEKLNAFLDKIPVRTEGGSIKTPVWDSSSPKADDEYTQKGFRAYVDEYFKVAGQGDGLLMMTETIQDQSGGLRKVEKKDMDEDINYFDQSKFSFKKHEKVSEEDVKKAIAEAKFKVVDGVRRSKEMAEDESGLRDMIKSNPVAVGQLLARKPEMAALVCNAINSIESQDQYQKGKDELIMWGGLIVGGGLTLTGIGAGVGAALIAGTGAAATLSTVAAVTVVAGSTLGAFDAGYSSVRAIQIRADYKNLETAVLSHNTDNKGAEEAQDALEEYKEARLSASLAITMSLADAGALKYVTKVPSQNLAALKKLNGIYRKVADTKVAGKLREVVTLMGEHGAQKLDEFFGTLTNASESLRLKLLEHMSSSKFTPDRFKKLVDEALQISAEQCAT